VAVLGRLEQAKVMTRATFPNIGPPFLSSTMPRHSLVSTCVIPTELNGLASQDAPTDSPVFRVRSLDVMPRLRSSHQRIEAAEREVAVGGDLLEVEVDAEAGDIVGELGWEREAKQRDISGAGVEPQIFELRAPSVREHPLDAATIN